jgi:uncharacterized membrane protein YkoI
VNATIGSAFLFATLGLMALAGQADDRPPQRAKPLVEIIAKLEEQGFTPIVDVSFDDGVWEIEAYYEDVTMELDIDPQSGEILSEHRDDAEAKPPADSLPLSDILRALEKAGYEKVSEASFERRSWEVEAVNGAKQKRELRVNPKDAHVISDRVDD